MHWISSFTDICRKDNSMMEVQEKENAQESAVKDGQVEPAQPRQPLQDVLNQTRSGIPVPARCKIPVPQKHVSRIPGLKHSSHRPSGLPRKSFCPKPQTSQKKDEKTSTKLRDSLVPKSVADNAISEVLEHSAEEKTEKDLKVSECGLKEKELQNSEPDVAESSGKDRIQGSSETGKSSVVHDCEKNVTTDELPPALHDGRESKNIETAEIEDTTEHQSFGERKQVVGQALESGRNNECAPPHFEKSKKEEKSVLPICQKKDDKAVPLSTLHKDKKTVHFYEATKKKEINPLPHEDEKLYEHNGDEIVRPHCDSCMSCDCVSHLKESGQILVDSEHYHTLKDDVKVTKRILLLMERLNASTSEELFEATTQVGGLAAELKSVKQENARLTSEVAALHIALSDKEAEKEALTQAERESAALVLEDLEDRLQKETKQTNDLQLREQELKARQDSLYSELEMVISHHEETISKQKRSLEYRDRQIEEQISVIQRLSAQVEQLEGVKDSMEFLEAEYKTLAEDHGALRKSNRENVQRLEECEGELADTQNSLTEREKAFREVEIQLNVVRSDGDRSRAELSALWSVGREILVSHNRDIESFSQLICTLSHDMIRFLKSLLSAAGMKVSESLVRDFGQKSDHPWMHSLVAEVLGAVNNGGTSNNEEAEKLQAIADGLKDESPENKVCVESDINNSAEDESQSVETKDCLDMSEKGSGDSLSFTEDAENLDSPTTRSRQNLGSSFSKSAFQPLKGVKVQHAENKTDFRCNLSSEGPVSPESIADGIRKMLGVSLNSEQDKRVSLIEEVKHLGLVLSEIVRINRILEEATLLSIDDLRKEGDTLRDQMWHTKMDLMTREEELKAAQTCLTESQSAVSQLTSEKRILAVQQEELLDKLQENLAESAPVISLAAAEGRFYTEKLRLKKEVYVLQGKLSEKQEEYDTLHEKASRRIKVLMDNCEKADKEVTGLDKIVEKVRKVLRRNKPALEGCDQLLKLMKELDGTNSSEESMMKLLEPVKTTAW